MSPRDNVIKASVFSHETQVGLCENLHLKCKNPVQTNLFFSVKSFSMLINNSNNTGKQYSFTRTIINNTSFQVEIKYQLSDHKSWLNYKLINRYRGWQRLY